MVIEDAADRLIEWSADLEESERHRRLRIFFLVATVAAFVWFMIVAIPFFLLLTPIFLVIFLVFRLYKTTTFDFSLNGDVFRASVIYNQRRRRKKIKFRVSDINYIVRKVEQEGKTKFYCDKTDEGSLCTIVANYKGSRLSLVVPLNDEFLRAVRTKVR
ncbi:MAG: hypothetical protein LUD14_04955 [Clostridiales bacterium]|nr:hypothetical protein [Clostridiales bacterium]